MKLLQNASIVYLNGKNVNQIYLNGLPVWGISPSVTPTPTVSVTPTITTTPSLSVTPTVTSTPSISITPTPTITSTPTVSITPSVTVTPTITPSITPSTSVMAQILYSNFNLYIVNGVRQATTGNLIRTNISTARRLIVTETITITGFKFIRIPPDNWLSITGYAVTGTLSVVTGTGATIDGGTSNKSFNTKSSVYNPAVVAERANTTSQYDIYDVRPVNNSTTTLTPGEYNFSMFGTSANMTMAVLTNTIFPIDTTRLIYPSPTAATTHFAMEVF